MLEETVTGTMRIRNCNTLEGIGLQGSEFDSSLKSSPKIQL